MGRILYKKVNQLNNTEAAYLAGLIDGEGTVTLTRHNSWRQRSIAVTICNTEYNLLESTFKIMGVGKITTKKSYRENHNPAFTYQLHGRQAINLLNQVYPYLKSYKRKRAELVMKYYVKLTPRNGKYSEKLLAKRERFIESFFKLKSVV